MRHVNTERIIGEFTIAVGISLLFPSASILWDAADDFMTRPFWCGVMLAFGGAIVYCATKQRRKLRLFMLLAALLPWGTMLAVYAVHGQATPMAFASVVILYHVLQRLWELWGQRDD